MRVVKWGNEIRANENEIMKTVYASLLQKYTPEELPRDFSQNSVYI